MSPTGEIWNRRRSASPTAPTRGSRLPGSLPKRSGLGVERSSSARRSHRPSRPQCTQGLTTRPRHLLVAHLPDELPPKAVSPAPALDCARSEDVTPQAANLEDLQSEGRKAIVTSTSQPRCQLPSERVPRRGIGINAKLRKPAVDAASPGSDATFRGQSSRRRGPPPRLYECCGCPPGDCRRV